MKLAGFFLIVCASVILHVRSEEITKERAVDIAKECKEEVGASDADIDALMKHEETESTEGKCLHACVMKKFGLMNADGKLDKDVGLNILKVMAKGDEDKEKLGSEIVDVCESIDVNDDHCEAAAEYGACLKREAEERGVKFGV